MELTRSFLGIRPPPEVQQMLAEVQMQLRRKAGAEVARWTPAHELYLNICALGELTASILSRIPQVIGPVAAGFLPVNLVTEGVGGSPSSTQPRIVWAGISGDVEKLESLHSSIEQALALLDLNREPHRFYCHIVLGRLRTESESARSDLGRAIRMMQTGTIGLWTATAIELLRSEVGPTGPTLATMQSFPLRI